MLELHANFHLYPCTGAKNTLYGPLHTGCFRCAAYSKRTKQAHACARQLEFSVRSRFGQYQRILLQLQFTGFRIAGNWSISKPPRIVLEKIDQNMKSP